MDQEGNRGQFDPPVSETPEEAARIREQIEQTRANLSGTIEELQDRLQPENLVSQAGSAMRGAVEHKVKTIVNTASVTASRVAEQARSSAESLSSQPLPTALALGGLAWWMMRGRRSSYRGGNGAMPSVAPAVVIGALSYYLLSHRGVQRVGPEEYGEAGSGTASLGERVRRVAEAADEYRQRAQAVVGSYAGQTAEQARHVGDITRVRMEESTIMLQERWQEVGETIDRWLHENPLTVGVAAFALGAIAGLSVPTTEAEHRTLGVARDSLMQQAGRAVGSAVNPTSQTQS